MHVYDEEFTLKVVKLVLLRVMAALICYNDDPSKEKKTS